MSKIRHYNSSFSLAEEAFYSLWPMTKDFGKSCTDISNYRPDISTVRAFSGSKQSSDYKLLYDFPDGKDTGQTIQTLLRDRGLDCTEVDAIGEILRQKVDASRRADEDELLEKSRTLEAKEFLDWAKNYIKSNPSSPDVSPSQPATS